MCVCEGTSCMCSVQYRFALFGDDNKQVRLPFGRHQAQMEGKLHSFLCLKAKSYMWRKTLFAVKTIAAIPCENGKKERSIKRATDCIVHYENGVLLWTKGRKRGSWWRKDSVLSESRWQDCLIIRRLNLELMTELFDHRRISPSIVVNISPWAPWYYQTPWGCILLFACIHNQHPLKVRKASVVRCYCHYCC